MSAQVLAPPEAPARTPAPHWVRALPWLAAGLVLVAVLSGTGTPGGDMLRYAAYWALALLLPGTLVHRALRGSRGNLPEDLGFGAATGLLLELAAWALAAATGQQALLRWWPALVLVAFAAVPRLRRHVVVRSAEPMPLRWAWATAAVFALVAGVAWLSFAGNPLPPVDFRYYQDLMYHLALVQELTRAMPFEVPQLAGEALRYHYLSDAHMAAASTIADVPPATVLLRLWLVPVVWAAALITGALARDLTGRWWAFPLAAAGAWLGRPVTLGAPVEAYGSSPMSYGSPSQSFSAPLVLLVVSLALDVLRGRPLGRAWALVPLLGLACAGSKASALPPVIAGLLLCLLVRRSRAQLVFLAVLVAAMLAGTRLFAGGGAGSLGVQALSLLRWMPPYQTTLGENDGFAQGGLVPPGVAAASAAGWVFVALIVGWWVFAQGARFAGLAGLGRRPEPEALLLGGAVLAGAGAAWTFYHPSASQLYFVIGAFPLGVLLTVRLVATLPRPAAAAVALAAGAVAQAAVPALPVPESASGWAWTLAAPVLVAAAAAVAGYVATRSWARVAAVGAAALLGASVAAGVGPVARGPEPEPPVPPVARVTAAEMRAALWLDAHTGPDDVVATNVHCSPVATTRHCDARAFWVAGLGGRRVLVESWAYGDEAVASHGAGGQRYYRQPAPDAELFARNERVFTAPDPADLAALRALGVRWLFADTRAGRVDPRLAELAPVRHADGPVTIHELR